MKIITIVGARPQFVKSSIVSKRLKEKNIEEKKLLNLYQNL